MTDTTAKTIPATDIADAAHVAESAPATTTPIQFADLKLDPKVLQAVIETGYTLPTPIQAGAIPPALEGRDVLGIAQTGTGKTASFTLPMITLLGRGRARARMPRSLVLCPTRELAAQVAENFETYAKHTRLTKALLIGGVSMKEQELLINRGVDVLIATPGRLLDHFERGNLLLQGVQIMVVDEADRMLDMGFIPDIERIFQLTPFTRQTLFFSATMAPEIERITDTFLHSPARIEVARQATASEMITQRLIELTPTRKDQTAKQKRELLRAIIDSEGAALKNAIIFCNRKTEVDVVAKSLKSHGYDAAPIHGDLDQSQRTRTLEGFRDGSLRFLIASDVAARGLDIPAVSHVFNFDLPSHAEDYVHRIGRTGRAGLEGTAISLAVPSDEKYLGAIENLLKRSLPRAPLPEGFSVAEGRDEAPRPERESRDSGQTSSRTRSRRSSSSRDDKPEVAAPRSDAPQAAAAPAPTPSPAPTPAQAPNVAAEPGDRRQSDGGQRRDRKPEADATLRSPAREAGRDDRRRDRNGGGDSRRDDTRRDQPRRDDRGGRGGAPLAFGDYVPDFMERSFRVTTPAPAADVATDRTSAAPQQARTADEGRAADQTAAHPATDARAAQTESRPDEAASSDKPATRSRRRRKPAAGTSAEVGAATEPTEATSEAQAQSQPAAAAQPAPVAADAEAKPAAKPRRSRKPKAEAADAAAAPQDGQPADQAVAETTGEATPPAPKAPRKRRTTKADASPADDSGTAAADDAKPARTSRTRTRRKPADAAQDDGSAADPAPAPEGSGDA